MTQKKNPYLKLAGPVDLEKIKQSAKRHRKDAVKRWSIAVLLIIMIVSGSYLLVKNRSYTSVRKAASYEEETSDTNRYAQFGDGIVRYSRDGIVYLNRKNEEQWIQPCQMKNPVIDTGVHGKGPEGRNGDDAPNRKNVGIQPGNCKCNPEK